MNDGGLDRWWWTLRRMKICGLGTMAYIEGRHRGACSHDLMTIDDVVSSAHGWGAHWHGRNTITAEEPPALHNYSIPFAVLWC